MTIDFLARARDRRIEALIARSLLLSIRHRRPPSRVLRRWLRGLRRRKALAPLAPRSPDVSLALSGATGRGVPGCRFGTLGAGPSGRVPVLAVARPDGASLTVFGRKRRSAVIKTLRARARQCCGERGDCSCCPG